MKIDRFVLSARRLLTSSAAIVLALASASVFQQALAQEASYYEYIFPKPNSEFLRKETSIIVRPGGNLDSRVLEGHSVFRLVGSKSGIHEGQTIVSDDKKTIVFKPLEAFEQGERVTVTVNDGIRLENGQRLKGMTFSFIVQSDRVPDLERSLVAESSTGVPGDRISEPLPSRALSDTLPADFPLIRIDSLNNPAPGNVFLANFGAVGGVAPTANYLLILDNAGKPVSYKRVSPVATTFAYNFTTQPNGLVSYVEKTLTTSTVRVLDTTLSVVESYQGGNGYNGDIADFRIMPNGHVFLLMYDWQIVDMSKIVAGGNPGANVAEAVIQELDLERNVVFQWRSLDYIPITDAYVDSLASTIDYIHANGFEFEKDGGILLSSRHLSEITKINGSTGDIIWRLGGKRNQFRFVGELENNKPNYFSFQHDVSRLANGNILLFDNGNQHTPQFSRVVEYSLDEETKVATFIWDYRHRPDIFSSANGSAQRLPNGNTFIGWGNAGLTGLTSVTEVHPDKSIAFELTLTKGQRSWRAYRFPWKQSPVVASFTREVLQGNTYSFNDTTDARRTGVRISFDLLQPIFYNIATVDKYATSSFRPQFTGKAPRTAASRFVLSRYGMTSFNANIMFDVTLLKDIPDPNTVNVYRRDSVGSGIFSVLPTYYNPATKELTSSTSRFGEFIFGWDDSDTTARPPVLLAPANRDSVNQLVPQVLSWSPKGYAARFQIQVATDSLFQTLILNDSVLTVATDAVKNLKPRSPYFWRVRAFNGLYRSAWSAVWSFTVVPPYIAVLSPKDKESWQRGKSYYIVWHSNIAENVRIDLYRNGIRSLMIKDSVANVGSYVWTILPSLPVDTAYSFRIRSVADTLLFGFSSRTFAVSPSSGVAERGELPPLDFQLSQNYPNPFNPSTTIQYHLPARSRVRLEIYNLLGQRVALLAESERPAGVHTIVWKAMTAAGVYFCCLEATALDNPTNKFLQVQKLVLLR
jgi:hypothetical protein